jgi:hypothetical protein
MRKRVLTIALVVAAAANAVAQQPVPIQDNSFLMEEAYNQERGIVQHISTLLRAGRSWAYSFTQEWPLAGQRHQLSFTIPVEKGVGDVALNYRQQVAGIGGGTAFAPRVSILVPTRRDGGTAVQLNLPVSVTLARPLVAHLNAGATATRRSPSVYNAGASLIWLARPTINAMLELVWTGDAGSGELIVNPGVRWAHDVGNLQIVPGISFPNGRDVFFYLSFEHPFKS